MIETSFSSGLNHKLEWCSKCNAYVPDLKHHTCAKRLVGPAMLPFTAEQEQRLREIVREELRRFVK